MICFLEPINRKDGKSGDTNATEGSGKGNQNNESDIPTAGEETGEQDSATHDGGVGDKKRRESRTSIYADDVEVPLQTIADCGKHLDYYEKSRLGVGIIILTTQTSHPSLAALASPASSCKVTALAVLKPPPSFSMTNLADGEAEGHLTPGSIMRRWMKENNLGNHAESVAVLGGEEGAKQIVERPDVDAVFLIVPDDIHRKYALSALENKKHVLLNDPVSISLQDFNDQLDYARRFNKFVQSSTAFINQYRVRKFMECVLSEERLGRITSINAHLSVCRKDWPLVGVNSSPQLLGRDQGCIRRLGRYCVLFSILLFTKLGSHPVSAQVNSATVQEAKAKEDDNNNTEEKEKACPREPISAKCTLKYSDNRVCTFSVNYSQASSTRQKVEVKTDTSMATMSDFVFPHPDGLATYRIYDLVPSNDDTANVEWFRGEAIDIAGGPTHDVVMWRKFAELSRTVDNDGWEGDNPLLERVRELAEITLHTKSILNALMKSFDEGFVEIPLVS